jgi:hypothetical protein
MAGRSRRPDNLQLEILDAPTAIWVDLRHLADRQPESPEREEVCRRLRNVMAGWLLEEPQRFRKRFRNEHYAHADFSADVILEMPAETRTRLAAHACLILQDSGDALPAAIQQALMIRNFLSDDARVALSQKLAETDPHTQILPSPDRIKAGKKFLKINL